MPTRPAFSAAPRFATQAGLILLLLAGLLSLWVLRGLSRAEREAGSSAEVEYTLRSTVLALTTAETGQRGYLLTGREDYLQSFNAAEASLPRLLASLDRQVRPAHDADLADLAAIQKNASLKMAELRQTIALRRAGNAAAALKLVNSDAGRSYMAAVYDAASRIRSQAAVRAAAAGRRSNRARKVAYAAIGGFCVLAVLLLIVIDRVIVSDQERHTLDEAALHESESELRLLTNTVPALISYVDSNRCYRRANLAYHSWYGYDPETMVGRSVAEVLGPERYKAIRPHLDHALAGEHVRFQMEDQAGRIVEVSYTPDLAPDGAVRGISIMVLDITARRRAENAIRDLNASLEHTVEERTHELTALNHELQQRNADLEAFSYSVSHDLRAPLRAVQGFAGALLEDYGHDLDEKGLLYLREIERGGQRMTQLIDDLLAYSRLSRSELKLTPVPLSKALDRALQELGEESRRNIDVEVDSSLLVCAHAPTLAQVITNLLQNAVKFGQPGIPPHVRVCAEQKGQFVRLNIQDNGIGIAPEHHDRIFHVFERLHGQEAYPGTGIGLAIVRRAVDRMQGEVGVDSVPGQGSNFWIEVCAA